MSLQSKRGFTLIEVVIAAAVFVVFAAGGYQAYTAVYTSITSTRARAQAADLANAKFETIKNMPYYKVGTVGGTPSGVILAVETVVRDSITFTVTTTVRNIDDPFDGLSGGADLIPRDYKLVEINITCATCKSFAPIIITGRVAPKNLESTKRTQWHV